MYFSAQDVQRVSRLFRSIMQSPSKDEFGKVTIHTAKPDLQTFANFITLADWLELRTAGQHIASMRAIVSNLGLSLDVAMDVDLPMCTCELTTCELTKTLLCSSTAFYNPSCNAGFSILRIGGLTLMMCCRDPAVKSHC